MFHPSSCTCREQPRRTPGEEAGGHARGKRARVRHVDDGIHLLERPGQTRSARDIDPGAPAQDGHLITRIAGSRDDVLPGGTGSSGNGDLHLIPRPIVRLSCLDPNAEAGGRIRRARWFVARCARAGAPRRRWCSCTGRAPVWQDRAMQIIGLDPTTTEFRVAWERQRRIHARVVTGTSPNTLYLVEHDAVYTAGVRTLRQDLPANGADVVEVDRGGRITWHGPGQLVAYPIFHLPRPLDVVAYVRDLENTLIAALTHLDISGYTRAGKTGVWVRTAQGRPSKIAFIGVRDQQGVSLHGFAMNCSNCLTQFTHIVTCGLTDEAVTTISEELWLTITPSDVSPLLCVSVHYFYSTYRHASPRILVCTPLILR